MRSAIVPSASAMPHIEKRHPQRPGAEALVDPPAGIRRERAEGERDDDGRRAPPAEQRADQERVEQPQLEQARDRDVDGGPVSFRN